MFKQLDRDLKAKLAVYKTTSMLGHLANVRVGLERETLRVDSQGNLAKTAHNERLGSPMCHESITTDFSENLLEFVTKANFSVEKSLEELTDIHLFTMSNLEQESLWPSSIPPVIHDLQDIPIAQYGHSNQAKMKTLYRKGLSLRYGKAMQSIAGIHYNFSVQDAFFDQWYALGSQEKHQKASYMPKYFGEVASLQDLKNKAYLNVTRNVLRFGFIIPYLFGASPVVHKSFLQENSDHKLHAFNADEYYLPYATSLRLSDLGYNNTKCRFFVSSNAIDEYIHHLNHAINKVCPDFAKFGVTQNGEYLQISDHILQIENEYYTSIRPKPLPVNGERPLLSLKRHGIGYVELRSLDVSPFSFIGLEKDTAKFLQLFLTACLLIDASPLTKEENILCLQNLKNVAEQGRNPDLQVELFGQIQPLKATMLQLFDLLQTTAEVLGEDYENVCQQMRLCVEDVHLTTSARIMNALENKQESMQAFIFNKSREYYAYAQQHPLSAAKESEYQRQVALSLAQYAKVEAEPQTSFATYLEQYFQSV